MSYSFAITAANKAAAKEAVAAKVAGVIEQQPIHTRDSAAILANANTIIDLLGEDDSKNVVVSCNGYLSWNGVADTESITTVSISCTANHAPRA